MTVALRTYDDGAWVSVDDTRTAGAGELWRIADAAVCGCPVAELVVEGVLEVGADGRTVDARLHGRCASCGDAGTTGWLPVGRIVDGTFAPLAPGAIRRGAAARVRSRTHSPE